MNKTTKKPQKNNIDLVELLTKFIQLRKKILNKKPNEDTLKQFKYYENLCVKTFEPLIQNLCKKYIAFDNYDDLLQEARIALVDALQTFEIKKGGFKTWASFYIKTRLSRRANLHSTLHIPLKKAAKIKPIKTSIIPVMLDTGMTPLQTMESNEITKLIYSTIDALPDEHKKVITLNGIKQYSITQISQELKMSQNKCKKLLSEAKKKIQKEINNLNNY